MQEAIGIGYETFLDEGGPAFGALRELSPNAGAEIAVYVDNAGEFIVPLTAVATSWRPGCWRRSPTPTTPRRHTDGAQTVSNDTQPLGAALSEDQRQRLEALRNQLDTFQADIDTEERQ